MRAAYSRGNAGRGDGPSIRSVFPDKPEVIDRRITVEALQGQQQLTGLKDTAFPAAGISLFHRARADGAVLLAAQLGAGPGHLSEAIAERYSRNRSYPENISVLSAFSAA